jgi:hypothetical protein
VQTSLIADSLIFSLTFCEEVFPCGTKSWFTALTLAASLEGISMQSRSWTGSLASEDRVEFSVCWVFSGSVSVSVLHGSSQPCWNTVEPRLEDSIENMARRFVINAGVLKRLFTEYLGWIWCRRTWKTSIMLKRHWFVACPRYVCNMVKMPAWIIGSLTPIFRIRCHHFFVASSSVCACLCAFACMRGSYWGAGPVILGSNGIDGHEAWVWWFGSVW